MNQNATPKSAGVRRGRFTTQPVDAGVVFLIGMRFNALHRVDKWVPVFTAMPKMLSYLARRPELGLLSYDLWFGRTTLALTYWNSTAKLHAFAADRDAPHLEPWRAFLQKIGTDGTVGIWHETYEFSQGSYEAVYANMPAFGLGKAVGVRPIGPGLATARQRMDESAELSG